MRSPFSIFSRKKKDASATASTSDDQAATKLQAIARGRSARKVTKGMLGQIGDMFGQLGEAASEIFSGAQDTAAGIFTAKAKPATDAEVEAPTPESRWFTPREGWRATDAKGLTPTYMMPTAQQAEALFPLESDILGELRVELLEIEGLPNRDAVMGISAGNLTDAYAMVLFEGAAARTNVIYDSLNPRWAAADPSSFRAFAFPIVTPYSVLYVSINDYGARAIPRRSTPDLPFASRAPVRDCISLQTARRSRQRRQRAPTLARARAAAGSTPTIPSVAARSNCAASCPIRSTTAGSSWATARSTGRTAPSAPCGCASR